MTYTSHQFNLFKSTESLKGKVPISAERIKEAKALLAKGDYKDAAQTLRDIREKLEEFENRITHKPKHQ